MANEVLSRDDLFEKGLAEMAIQDLKSFNNILEQTENSLKTLGQQFSKSFEALDLSKSKDIEKLEKLTLKTVKAEEQLTQVRQKRQKVNKALAIQTDEEVKARLRFQKVQKTQRDLLRAEITLQEEQVKSLKDLREQNKALRVVRDSLDFKTQAADIEQLNNQIDANNAIIEGNVDQLTQQKIGIGRYREGVDEAIKANAELFQSFGPLGDILQVVTEQFVNLTDSQEEQAEQSKENEENTNRFSKSLKNLGKAAGAVGFAAVIAVLGVLIGQFRETQRGAILFESVLQQTLNTIRVTAGFVFEQLSLRFQRISEGISEFTNKILRAALQLDEFFGIDRTKELEQLNKELSASADNLERIETALDASNARDLNAELAETNTRVDALVESQFKLSNLRAQEAINIQRQLNLEERLLLIQEDDTRSFIERQEAAAELLKILKSSTSAANIELSTSREALDIARERAQISLRQANVPQERIDQLLDEKSLAQAILSDQELIENINIQVFEELKDAEVGYLEATGAASIQKLEVQQTRRKLLFNEVEQELDFLIDGNEQIKTTNEQRINDERANLKEREALLQETIDLIANSNEAVLNEVAKTVEGLEGVDIAAAFEEADGNVSKLNESLKELGLAEIPINRLRELFIEIQAQSRDFVELANSIEKVKNETVALEKDIAAQLQILNDSTIRSEEQLNEALEELAAERLQNEIDTIRAEIRATEAGSAERLRLINELNDLLIEQKKVELEAEKEKQDALTEEAKKGEEERRELLNESIRFAEQISKQISERRLAAIDSELQAVQNAQDVLIAQIESGNDAANASITELSRREAELRQQEEEELRKQQQRELVIAGIKAFAANTENDPDGALGKTVNDVTLLLGILRGIQGFYEGTEHVGKSLGKPHLNTQKDGYVVRVDGSERILGAKHSAQIPSHITNQQVVDAVKRQYSINMSDMPKMSNYSVAPDGNIVNVNVDNKGVERAVRNIKFPVQDMKVDEYAKIIKYMIEEDNRKKIKRERLKNLTI